MRRVALLTVAFAAVLILWRESATLHLHLVGRDLLRERPELAELPPGAVVYAPEHPVVRQWLYRGYRLSRVHPAVFYGGLLLAVAAGVAPVVRRRGRAPG